QGQASQALTPEKSRPLPRSSSEKVLEHSPAACGNPLNLQALTSPTPASGHGCGPKSSTASDEVTPPKTCQTSMSYDRSSHQAGSTPVTLRGKLAITASLNGHHAISSGGGGGESSTQATGNGSSLHRSDSHVSRFQDARAMFAKLESEQKRSSPLSLDRSLSASSSRPTSGRTTPEDFLERQTLRDSLALQKSQSEDKNTGGTRSLSGSASSGRGKPPLPTKPKSLLQQPAIADSSCNTPLLHSRLQEMQTVQQNGALHADGNRRPQELSHNNANKTAIAVANNVSDANQLEERCQRRGLAGHPESLTYTGDLLNPQRLDSGFTSIEDELDDACPAREILTQRLDALESSATQRKTDSCGGTRRSPFPNNILGKAPTENSERLSAVNASRSLGDASQIEDESDGANTASIITGVIMGPSDLSPVTEQSEQVSSESSISVRQSKRECVQHAEEIHVTSTSSTSISDPNSTQAGLPDEKTLEEVPSEPCCFGLLESPQKRSKPSTNSCIDEKPEGLAAITDTILFNTKEGNYTQKDRIKAAIETKASISLVQLQPAKSKAPPQIGSLNQIECDGKGGGSSSTDSTLREDQFDERQRDAVQPYDDAARGQFMTKDEQVTLLGHKQDRSGSNTHR
ncbi:hypothetical protein BIW11_06690, partial [Tropilaelaps mercedesae]